MKDRPEDDPFTAQERALLAAWDRHNAQVAAREAYDVDLDHLIAACQVAQEAALRSADTDDGAICRQIAADAHAAGTVAGGGAHLRCAHWSDL